VHHDDSGDTSIRSRTASPDGRLGETLHVSPDEEETVIPDLATDPSGNSIVTWGRQAPLLIVGSRFATAVPPAVTPPTVQPPVPPIAPVSYRLHGRPRVARLRITQPAVGRQPKLRLRLPRKLARKLEHGTRVRLTLRLRARSAGPAAISASPGS
jgi:hypothetical protein